MVERMDSELRMLVFTFRFLGSPVVVLHEMLYLFAQLFPHFQVGIISDT